MSSTMKFFLAERLSGDRFSEAWLAHEVDSERRGSLVLRVLLGRLVQDTQMVNDFVTRGLVASRLDHPNIAKTQQVGRIRDTFFLAEEHVPGCSLRQLQEELKSRQKLLPPWLSVLIVLDACRAFQYAHASSPDNRRAKRAAQLEATPETLMIGMAGEAKLVHFGTGELTLGPDAERDPLGGDKMYYRAPEELGGATPEAPGPRADVFTLAVLLYEALVGKRPYEAEASTDLADRIRSERPPAPASLVPWIPARLSAVVMHALEPEPAERHESVTHLADELVSFLSSMGMPSSRRPVAGFLRKTLPELDAPRADSDAMAADEQRIVTAIPFRSGIASGRSVRKTTLAHGEEVQNGADAEMERLAFRQSAPPSSWDAAVARRKRPAQTAWGGCDGTWSQPLGIARSEDAERRFREGLTLTKSHQYEAAAALWEEALQLDPTNRAYRANLLRLRSLLSADNSEAQH